MGGALALAPEIALPTLKYFYSHFRLHIWTAYSFRDAFNLHQQWYDSDELGIDQGPIVLMIENYRTRGVWRQFMQSEVIQRGLQRAGFVSLPFVPLDAQAQPADQTVTLSWGAAAGRTYQVEYSTNLMFWVAPPTGEVTATNSVASWTDRGPPATLTAPFGDTARFYRIFRYGSP